MKKFRTSFYPPYIKEIEVERESNQVVWVDNDRGIKLQRVVKRTKHQLIADTREEAEEFILDHFMGGINRATYALKQKTQKYNDFKAYLKES